MKDQLISYPTAILAKEKLFHENCDVFYRRDRTYGYAKYYDPTPNNEDIDTEYFSDADENNPALCAVPTQSLLQRWLREVHDCHIIICVGDDGLPNYDYCVMKDKVNYNRTNGNYTYELALENALQEALKLIA